ncbi:hypothetical protein [uncultured Thiodictyon sp.]|jgi:hypothetical protein|uniref:hypothetical protein n=1 Tax=uncultured Thiodictyon sp. TaxID=1846217 RepID=UPI0025CD78E7|nr:hypothetical protein [uncultured Thiodictyon sp.]
MRLILCSFIFLCAALPVAAAPSEPAVPPDLWAWVPWVLHPQDQRTCPLDAGAPDRGNPTPTGARVCAWPGRLELDLNQRGGSFTQRWQVYAQSWVTLPGDTETWPQGLRDGDQPLPVVLRDGAPAVQLTPGTHVLTGQFQWRSPPDGLSLPAEIGLLSLVLDGAPVPFPRLDRGGRLWLGEPLATEGQDGDRLTLQVYRRIDDDLPLRVTTRLELDVAGRARQVLLGPVLLPGTIPLRVQSPLPSRLDPDGALWVQARPGHWVLEVEAQVGGAVSALTRGTPPAPWPALEVWSFAARPGLRQVEVRGPAPADPRQAGVPADWSDLPAWRLAGGESLTLVERRRGNPDPGPDRLTLERDLWLDLAGGAFSVRDRISGELTRSWRLTALPPLDLGRVAVDGEPRLITRLAPGDPPGVEVRRGRLDLVADSRLAADAPHNPKTIPATGWGLELAGSRAHLWLPPGWDLLAASGTDNLPDSWIGRWTLLDLFLVLLLALGSGRLWGTPWGLLAGLTLVLTWQVADAPRLVWVNVLIAVALLRQLPRHPAGVALGRFRGLVEWYRRLALAALLLIGLPFLAAQVRTGLYPHLERPMVGLGTSAGALGAPARRTVERPPALASAPAPAMPPGAPQSQFESLAEPQGTPAGDPATSDDATDFAVMGGTAVTSKESGRRGPATAPPPPPTDRPDPDAVMQSGPGVPDWQWNRFELAWSGPVTPGEDARLWLLSPAWHLWWSLLGALLTVLLGLRVAGLIGRPAPPPPDAATPPAPSAPRSEAMAEPPSEPVSAPSPARSAEPAVEPVTKLAPESVLRLMLPPLPPLVLAALLGAAGLAGPGAAPARAADLPGTALLEELRARLLAPPDCLPDCVDLPSLSLSAQPHWLRLTLTLDAAAAVAAAVPGGAGGWLPTQVDLDGVPVDGLRRGSDDRLLVPLPAGRHRLDLSGPLPERTQVEIPFPLRPRQLEATLDGWTLEGLDSGGLPGPQVRLLRLSGGDGAAAGPLNQGALPPLLRVERGLRIGLDWRVQTRVRRLSPAEFPVSLPVALLPGEAVQTPGLAIQEARVLVNLAPGETEFAWASTLEPAATLRLTAVTDPRLTESWSLALSPRWHLDWSGPAPIQQAAAADRWQPTWRPLPGETLDLTLTRPGAVPGRTLTLERVDLRMTLGRRTGEGELRLELRATQGGLHPIRLPPEAVPTRLQAGLLDLPLPGPGAPLELPLVPGHQSILVQWRQPQEMGLRSAPGLPDLNSPAVNVTLALRLPQGRWVLFTGGPRIGPVVLFWGVLLILAGLAAALGRLRLTPLKTHDWLLLGIGLSLAQIWVLVLVAGWLLALGLRRQLPTQTPRRRFNLVQVALAVLTVAAGAGLIGAVSQGLLGAPAMQIMGNGSGNGLLQWYQDRTTGPLPPIWVISVPIWVYRALMLAWALWLALRLLSWLRWGWDGFSRPVLGRPGPPRRPQGPGRGDSPPPDGEELTWRADQ